ncbi:hypothetical protein ACLESO_17285 [Pyxidicoccus sp. 3LG]
MFHPVADNGISQAQVERMVTLANLAPSGDNCQPWRFRWDGAVLTVLRDGRRAGFELDHDGELSRLALGCVLEALSLAAAGEGLGLSIEATAHDTRDGATWATVRLSPGARAEPQPQDLELLRALPERTTDRRHYRGGSESHPVFTRLQEEAARVPGCVLRVRPPSDPELLDYLCDVDGYVWSHEVLYRDVMRWIRFSHREVQATRDGVPWCSMGIDFPEGMVPRFSRSRLAHRLISGLGLHAMSRAWVRRQLGSSAALVCLAAPPGGADTVTVGRLGMRVWLRLTQADWGVHPFTLPASFARAAVRGSLPPVTRPEYAALFTKGRDVLSRAFGLSNGELPVWLFRTGESTPLPAHTRTLRLPTERLLTVSGRVAEGS